jgi:predicted transcriptional regulator
MHGTPTPPAHPPAADRTSAHDRLGPLEWRVLESLWDRAGRASVRDLSASFGDIAYTTLMTTLDRLHRKGLLERTKHGRAFLYWPRMSRVEFHSAQAARALKAAFEGGRSEPELLLSCLVDAVTEQDRSLLDDLEALVRARRAAPGGGRS